MEVEIGRGKKARQAYGFDDIAIVPSRRTRDPQDVDIGWKLGPHLLELPLLASAMDGVVSPQVAIELGKLGGLGVLNLEGIFSRYEDADGQLAKIAKLPKERATAGMQKIYAKGNQVVDVGSETVVVGAALIEKVGNPVTGAKNLLQAAAMQGAGALGVAGQVVTTVAPLAQAAVAGYQSGGASGAISALGSGALGMAAGMVPGGDAIMATAQGSGGAGPWRDQAQAPGAHSQ